MTRVGRRLAQLTLCAGLTLLVPGCGREAPAHTTQPPVQLPPIEGLTVAGATDWLNYHTLGCQLVGESWQRPQRWQCEADMRPVEAHLTVRIFGDEDAVYRIEAAVSDIPDRFDPDEYASGFFWNLTSLPFTGHADVETGRGAPDPATVTDAVRLGGATEFAGLRFDYSRQGLTRTLVIVPND